MTRGRVLAAVAIVAPVLALSPLTVLFTVAIVPAIVLGTRGLDRDERRWIIGVLTVAVLLRVAVVVGLFLATDHTRVPFGSFFGDEDYFIKRSLWLRNIALGIPVHAIDLEYAFEPNGSSSFLYVLAAIQVLTGPAPYGVHLVSIFCALVASLALYRLARLTFGRAVATFGIVVLLFLPSLFAWSLAVLKEPLFVLISAATLLLAVFVARSPTWSYRLLGVAGISGLALIQGTVREGGAAFTLAGVAAGAAIGFVVTRPRLLLLTVVAAPVVAAAILRMPEVQLRTYVAVQRAARQHWGAVAVSRGWNYHLLDDRFYTNINEASDLQFGETMRYLARAAGAFVAVPRPSDEQSITSVAYVPEQVIWYVLAFLVPAGLFFGLRRDPLVTGLLAAHALIVSVIAALTDGNVGTLVRHRGLALPYLVWLSGLGACGMLSMAARRCQAQTRIT